MRLWFWRVVFQAIVRTQERCFLLEDCYADRLCDAMSRAKLWSMRRFQAALGARRAGAGR